MLAACSALLCGAGGARPPGAGQVVRVPVRSGGFSLQAFLYRPAGGGGGPLVLLSHGSSGGDPGQEVPQAEQAAFFTARGYVVLAPMRRGRGRSGGASLESEDRNCDPASWRPGLDAAFEDVTAAIDHAAALPGVDASRVVLAGESRGGFLSVAYAATGGRRDRVAGVVNFVGGWVAQAEDRCPVDFNRLAFRRYGALTEVPELWLYGDRDRFYSTPSIRGYARAYAQAGGRLSFALIPRVPNNGHWLPGYPRLWSARVDRYLASRGLPAGGGRSRTVR